MQNLRLFPRNSRNNDKLTCITLRTHPRTFHLLDISVSGDHFLPLSNFCSDNSIAKFYTNSTHNISLPFRGTHCPTSLLSDSISFLPIGGSSESGIAKSHSKEAETALLVANYPMIF